MSAESLVFLYDDVDTKGRASVSSLDDVKRYERIPSSRLIGDGMLSAASSASVTNIPDAGATSLICFGPYLFEYAGLFVQLTSIGRSSELKLNFPSVGFNDMTTSALLVRQARSDEVRISFRTVFLAPWLDHVTAAVNGVASAKVTL